MKKYEEVGRLEGVPLVIQTLYYWKKLRLR
jgi:hypothetical protein